jgi:hypothetical protein
MDKVEGTKNVPVESSRHRTSRRWGFRALPYTLLGAALGGTIFTATAESDHGIIAVMGYGMFWAPPLAPS